MTENGANIQEVKANIGEVKNELQDVKDTVDDVDSKIHDMWTIVNTTTTTTTEKIFDGKEYSFPFANRKELKCFFRSLNRGR